MAKQKRYMALDFGIGHGVAMAGAFAGDTLELEVMHRFNIRTASMLGVSYWDFPGMLIHAMQGLSSYTGRYGATLAGVGCDSWAADFGFLDKTGHLLSNPVFYLDSRMEGTVEKLHTIFPDRSLYQRNGVRSQREGTLYQLFGMAQNNSPLLDKAVTMLLLADLVSYFMTGIPVQEYTLATTTGMYDAESRDWSRDIILGAKIPPGMVPEIVAPGTVIGPLLDSVASKCGLGQTPVIAPASHGMAAAVAAVPAAGDDWLCITSGYWNQVAAEVAAPVINDASFSAQLSNLGGVDGSIRLQREVMGLGGLEESLGDWSREEGKAVGMDTIIAAAESTPALTRIINPDDPRLIGAGDKIAAVNGILAETGQPAAESRGDFVRVYLDSMILSLRRAVGLLSEVTARKYGVIHFVGRGAAYPAVCQALADATGRVVKAGPVEARAVGNIVMQMLALGDVGSLTEARELVGKSFAIAEYVPGNGERWQEAFAKFEAMQ